MEENKNVETASTELNKGSNIGWGVLGFFFPIVGLILFLVWKNNRKAASKASGIGALVGFILGLISTILFFVLGLGALIGIGSVIENEGTDSPTKVEEKTPTFEGETVDSSDPCVVKATLGSKENFYVYDYAPSCDVTKVVDENNKLLFKAKNDNQELTLNGSIITNGDEELNNTDESFFKVGNSLVFYSSMCSPGYCYIFVYNTNDNSEFKIDNKIEKDILNPIIESFEIDGDNNLIVNFRQNEAQAADETDAKFSVYSRIRTCEIKDLDAALTEAGISEFPVAKKYTYKNENGNIINNPKVEIKETIEDLYKSFATVCSKNSN